MKSKRRQESEFHSLDIFRCIFLLSSQTLFKIIKKNPHLRQYSPLLSFFCRIYVGFHGHTHTFCGCWWCHVIKTVVCCVICFFRDTTDDTYVLFGSSFTSFCVCSPMKDFFQIPDPLFNFIYFIFVLIHRHKCGLIKWVINSFLVRIGYTWHEYRDNFNHETYVNDVTEKSPCYSYMGNNSRSLIMMTRERWK